MRSRDLLYDCRKVDLAGKRTLRAPGFCCRQQEVIIPADLPLVQELRATLREWAQIWHKLFVVRVLLVTLSSRSGLDRAAMLTVLAVF